MIRRILKAAEQDREHAFLLEANDMKNLA